MRATPPPAAPAAPGPALGWVAPAAALLGVAALLRLTLHGHWLTLVWAVHTLDSSTWPPLLTRVRYVLDALAPALAGLTAALLLRSGPAGAWGLAALTGALGVLSSGLLGPTPGAALLGGAALLTLLGWPSRAWGARPAQRAGALALAACLLVSVVGVVPADQAGAPHLFGSLRLGVWWNEVARPAVRDLGFLLALLGASLAWLEGRPGALRSGLARGAVALGLAAFTALIYVGTVGSVGALVGAENSLWLGVLAASVVAVGFGSARAVLVRAVNRLLYGARDDPFLVTRRLGEALAGPAEAEGRLDAALALLVDALRLPGAALALVDGAHLSRGTVGEQPGAWPLVVGGERVGTLLVAPRAAREAFSPADREVLAAVAGQMADAAHAWQLQVALRRSREHLVRAGEDERRRLRRDLHDGLGPALSGLGLKLEAARLLLARAPEQAAAHLTDLQLDVRESVGEVRRLVHDLRPPKLDDLGLTGALHEALSGPQAAGIRARLDVPQTLPPLSAAVEVAVYRIAQEALTNVVKHARARQVTVRLRPEPGTLTLDVEDDGVGLPDVREPGVGSRSMRERAEALSGTLTWLAGQRGGTLVRATLPTGDRPDDRP